MENNSIKSVPVRFAAIDPYVETNIVAPTEKTYTGRDRVEWGDGNAYPDYLLGLTKECPTLRSIIVGTTDFIAGDDVTTAIPVGGNPAGIMNRRGVTLQEQVRDIAADWMTYGGFALEVIRAFDGSVAEVNYIDLRFLRSNKENSVFYYSEKWTASSSRKVVEYPAYLPITPERWATLSDEDRQAVTASILFVKNVHTQTYPMPVYAAAVKACETERCIDDFHLNAINNGFTSSMIVNFNNGTPSAEMQEEVERNMNEKFTGHQNAGRLMLCWNESKDAATTIVEPKVEDFGDRYQALAKHVRQQIFTAFRANPNLFGIPTENLGFSEEEYASAFRLYNRTCVRPVQRVICDAYDRILGRRDSITIRPFSIEETATEQNVN